MNKVTNLLQTGNILLDLKLSTKDDILKHIATHFVQQGYASSIEQLLLALNKREEVDPTIIDTHVAMPHAKLKDINKASILILRLKTPVVWNLETKEKVSLIIMLGLPEHNNNLHIEVISEISQILLEESGIQKLLAFETPQEIINFLEKGVFSIDDQTNCNTSAIVDIVAITACPTGIAHTYMAADALKKAAKEQNITIRVETNGSDGPKDILTEQEISQAKAVIVASDRELDLSRFNGKKMLATSAGRGVRESSKLIKEALSPSLPVYFSSNQDNQNGVSTNKGIYGQLMTGVSYMLPFVVGGGILIALGFMFGITSADPNAVDYNPIAAFLNTLGGKGAFALMIPVLAGYIGFGIAERPALMPAMVGGSLAASSGGGFLGGLLAGFLGGYSIIILKKVFAKLPKSLEGIKPVLLYPVFGLLLMGLGLFPLLKNIAGLNSAIEAFLNSMNNTNLILLGAILGGMMAVDMGGPVNKAAFTFGIAAISAGNNYPHAAVMAGGMVPPLALALVTTIFKNKFSKTEREAGMTCYVLGASFITEGVIPFAASYPLIIIPACVIGSTVAGALSMFFGCQLPAPHGGIFVFPLITNVGYYILSILIGTLITTGIIGTLKKVNQ